MNSANIPDWVDRRTAEWCAEICEAVEARAIREAPNNYPGARACASAIRNLVAAARPALPATHAGDDHA